MSTDGAWLYARLPAVYRVRDAEQGYVLRALCEVLGEQSAALEADLDRLYDNWFIETCDEWVVPYIGDLLGVRDLVPVTEGVRSQRALVANVLAYRHGKGTAATLEQLARDITGWPARVVEFFELLAWSQYTNHVRPHAPGTAAIRDAGALELLGGPFESARHTAEIRHIDTGRGRYNIPHVGIFVWRLAAYPLERSPARPAGPGRYLFHQHGRDAPLFNPPLAETSITQLAGEVNVPGPIRRRALRDDLAAFRAAAGGRPDADLPAGSDYYGPDRGIEIVRGGTPVSPREVVAADLSAWDRPPPGVAGLRSGDLSAFPAISAAAPELAVTIGPEGPRVVRLRAVPADLDQARGLLESALRTVTPGAAFAGARALRIGDRLLVLPGVRGEPVTVAATAADATTAGQLRLDAAGAEQVHAVLSGRLTEPLGLSATDPEVSVRVAGGAPVTAALAAVPGTLADAAAGLRDAIRAAAPGAAFTGADVAAAGDRLLVLAGTAEPLTLGPTGDDPATARELRLSAFVAVDPVLGRLGFGLGDEPGATEEVLLTCAYGFAGDIGGGPYDRRNTLAGTGDGWARTVSQQGPADFATLAAALTAWADPAQGGRGDAVITITDNGAYREQLALVPADGHTLTIQAADGRRPRVRPLDSDDALDDLVLAAGGGPDAQVVLDGLLVEGGIRVEPGALGTLLVRHCTLVPGRPWPGIGEPWIDGAEPAAPSLLVAEPNDTVRVELARCITGPVHTPPDMRGLRITDSIVDAPTAVDLPALVSGSLSAFPALTSGVPKVSVTIGAEGPHIAVLPGVPGGLADARDLLAVAIPAAHRSQAFTGATVVSAGNRLVVLPGIPEPVVITAVDGDATADELRLDPGQAQQTLAAVTRRLEPFPALSAATPRLEVTMGGLRPRTAMLTSVPTTLPQARDRLQEAIRAADPDPAPAFAGCLVAAVADRLVVVPGAAHTPVRFGPTQDDSRTLDELGLAAGGVGLCAPGGGPGAPAELVRTTVLGEVVVRELRLASESICTQAVIAQRRQTGCVRFSFVPLGSVVPRRFHCQPVDAATAGRTRPVFTSMTYGHPGYGQLATGCPEEITAGAADEGEMGAFHLAQPGQRVRNLRASLDEYLRLGLSAGVLPVT